MIVLGAAQDRLDFETSLDTTALIWGSCHSRSRTLRAQQNSKGPGRYRPLVAMGSTWGPLGFSNQEQLDAKALATWPCGLMDKALVFVTKDCWFESCQGHIVKLALRVTKEILPTRVAALAWRHKAQRHRRRAKPVQSCAAQPAGLRGRSCRRMALPSS